MRRCLPNRLLLIICVSILLGGCTNSHMEDTQENSNTSSDKNYENGKTEYDFPSEYYEEIDGVKFDIDKVEIPNGVDLNGLYECNISKQRPNQDSIIKKYSQGKNITKNENSDSTDVDGSVGIYEYISYSDESNLYVLNGNMEYMTELASKVSYSFDADNMEKYSSNGNFDFLSSENAIKLVQDEVIKCGYELEKYDFKFFLLDHDTMQKEEKHEQKVGEKLEMQSEWSSDDDCYKIFINPTEQGIPVYFGNKYFMEDTDPTMMPVSGLISKNGVEELQIANMYSFTSEDKSIKMMEFDQCVKAVANKYGKILSENQYCVDRAKLYFVPVLEKNGTYSARLAWLFEIASPNEDNQYMLIDAENGEEITL